MEIEVLISVKQEILKTYSHYSQKVYIVCKQVLEDAMKRRGKSDIYASTVDDAIFFLKTKKFLYYRLVTNENQIYTVKILMNCYGCTLYSHNVSHVYPCCKKCHTY